MRRTTFLWEEIKHESPLYVLEPRNSNYVAARQSVPWLSTRKAKQHSQHVVNIDDYPAAVRHVLITSFLQHDPSVVCFKSLPLFQALSSQNLPIFRQHGSSRMWKIRTEMSAPAPQAAATAEKRSVTPINVPARQGSRRASDGGSRLAAAGLSLALSIFLSCPGSSAADAGMPGSGPGCTTSTNPSYSLVSCERTGLDRDGRLLGCRCVLRLLDSHKVLFCRFEARIQGV